MPHVSVHYKVYIPSGHHRQPRNASAQIEPNPSSEVDVQTPGKITPLYVDQLPYKLNGGSGLAQLLFWSVTDGTEGQIYPAGSLDQAVGADPLTITAWYWPISGPGVGDGTTAIIDDAFSAAKGNFIDDTFVTVTSDPSLTSQANAVGIVPTSVNETLQSNNSVPSTSEPFSQWISNGAGVATGNTLNVPAKATGIAIAVYQKSNVVLNKPPLEVIYGTIFGGVAVGGDGSIVINGVPRPIGPWSPLLSRLIASATVAIGAEKLDKEIGAQVAQLSLQDAFLAIKQVLPSFEKKAGK